MSTILRVCLLVGGQWLAPARAADVVVLGGVPFGIAAAITAAREGSTVVLVEPTRHVGGLSTSGINTAETEHMLKWTIGGFADEFYERLGKHYGTGRPEYFFESGVAEKVYLDHLREPGGGVRAGSVPAADAGGGGQCWEKDRGRPPLRWRTGYPHRR